MSEHALQRRVADYLRARGLLFRPGLEGMLTRPARIRAAQIGMVAGWPDFMIEEQPLGAIETKVGRRGVTMEQMRMMGALQRRGRTCLISRDYDEIVRWIDATWPVPALPGLCPPW
jgi:hypothetical protein